MEDIKQKIKEYNSGSFSNLIEILDTNSLFNFKRSPLLFSLFSSFVVTFIFLFSNLNFSLFKALLSNIEISLSIIPSLIGFTLACLTIIVSFSNKDFLVSISDIKANLKSEPSFYQSVVAAFSYAIMVQSSCLFIAVIFKISSLITPFISNINILKIINIFAFFILLFLIIYSVLLVPKMVLNIFRLSQSHHIFLSLKKLEEPEEKQDENNS